ncbi:MAG: 4-diphosphocytidyl-2C-methyl-D-erythritolkinase [Gemmatimonadetes bacterium]|nr:4-diphosphocytidyl-2C-methyl-D-erythritolkinase [Gemmatimonadota bacterium]
MPDAVSVSAPAKVNLRLRILAREASGYHGLETLFHAISLADEVTARRGAPGLRLTVGGGVDTGPADDNLVLRAARAFHGATGDAPSVDLHLAKRIPSAAGLGGGSSDAAATLRALNALHGGPLPPETLLQLAGGLGSDVPFFLCGSPYALAWSRGERLLALPPLPVRPVLVAHPCVAMPTVDAFRRVADSRGGGYLPSSASIAADELGGWEGVERLAVNDFEAGAVAAIPVLAVAKAAMRDAGARIALLAGSGASLFGVFADEGARDLARSRVEALGMACWSAWTLDAEVAPRVDFQVDGA